MQFSFSEEQLELKKSARKFLERASSPERVRAAMATDAGFDEDAWNTMASELGWLALTIPEEYDGLGLTFVDLAPLLEEMGRALYVGPFFSTVCLAANALLLGGTPEQKQAYLPGVAAGTLRATVAFAEPRSGVDVGRITTNVRSEGGALVLEGEKHYVLDGHTASLLVVVAREAGTTGRDGIVLLAVPADAPGVTRVLQPSVDQTRKLAKVTFTGVRLDATARLAPTTSGAELFERVLDRAASALAVEQAGGAEACLDMAVEYAKVRKQFGRPIGSFQAVQHTCANMLLRVESAKSAAYYATALAALDSPELREAASIAKAYCSEAFFACAADSIQVHGGIGFTWEHEAHLYFKRARAGEHFLGEPSFHRERILGALGLAAE